MMRRISSASPSASGRGVHCFRKPNSEDFGITWKWTCITSCPAPAAIVLNDVAFLNSRRSASSAGDAGQHPANAGGGCFTEIHDGRLRLFGNHQGVPRGQGVDVQERQRQIVFVDAVAGDGSIENAAED